MMNKEKRTQIKFGFFIAVPLFIFAFTATYIARSVMLKSAFTDMSFAMAKSMSYAAQNNSMIADVNGENKVIVHSTNANHIYNVIVTAGMNGRTRYPKSSDTITVEYGEGSVLLIVKGENDSVFIKYTNEKKSFSYNLGKMANYNDFLRYVSPEGLSKPNKILKP